MSGNEKASTVFSRLQEQSATVEQKRVHVVLGRLQQVADNDEDFAEVFTHDLDRMLNDIQCQDGFGTEGQLDPRGDQRDGQWSMSHVDGIDE